MFKKLLLASTCIIFLSVVVIITGMLISSKKISALEKETINNSRTINIDLSQVDVKNLPEPVQRYLDFSFPRKKKFNASVVKWKEKGTFILPEMGNFDIDAWQTSKTYEPEFLWRGFMKKAGGLFCLESVDYFNKDKHFMRAKLYGIFKVMHTSYEKQSEINSLHSHLLLRYFGSSLNFPWGLVSSPYVSWEPVDKNRAIMKVEYKDYKAEYMVSFEKDGRISKMEGTGFQLHGNYKRLKETAYKENYILWEGIRMPTKLEYQWQDENGEKSEYTFLIYDVEIIK